jgi:L-alanine-DL-glutamate epimerase-like enolase superfamily enzyme
VTERKAVAPIDRIVVGAYRIPTTTPESDGTLAWNATTMITVEISAGGALGFGYTYADRASAVLVDGVLRHVLQGQDALQTHALWQAMLAACRNLGQGGAAAMAISACDVALHDLKARLYGLPLAVMFGAMRTRVPVYGSGGFTSYSDDQLTEQFTGWAAQGIRSFKMKVGREPDCDPSRVKAARRAIGDGATLMVDANGGYHRKQALDLAARFAEQDVRWFEEPVSSNDLEGLGLIRNRAPVGMDITAGEYGFDARYFRKMADFVDVLQPDATRCCGYTGFLQADAVARACELPISSHCGPAVHLPCCCAALQLRHMEWFFDHVRIEHMLFDGAPKVDAGDIAPDLSRPGHGLTFKQADAERYRC